MPPTPRRLRMASGVSCGLLKCGLETSQGRRVLQLRRRPGLCGVFPSLGPGPPTAVSGLPPPASQRYCARDFCRGEAVPASRYPNHSHLQSRNTATGFRLCMSHPRAPERDIEFAQVIFYNAATGVTEWTNPRSQETV